VSKRLLRRRIGAQTVTNVNVNVFNRTFGNNYYAAAFNAARDFNDDGQKSSVDKENAHVARIRLNRS
jgi:hypothetical protein